jgi:hypothetical protein
MPGMTSTSANVITIQGLIILEQPIKCKHDLATQLSPEHSNFLSGKGRRNTQQTLEMKATLQSKLHQYLIPEDHCVIIIQKRPS